MFPRRPGCSVVEGKDITLPKVKALAKAADDCWNAILDMDLDRFAAAYKASFEAQVAMFPGMVNPTSSDGATTENPSSYIQKEIAGNSGNISHASANTAVEGFLPTVQAYIDKYSRMPGVLAWKMPGAGGGGYLVLVCTSRHTFPEGAIEVTVRRGGM